MKKHVLVHPMPVDGYVKGRYNLSMLGQGRPSPALYILDRLINRMPEEMRYDQVVIHQYLVEVISGEDGWDYGLTFHHHDHYPSLTKSVRPFVRLIKDKKASVVRHAVSWHALRLPIREELRPLYDQELRALMSTKCIGRGGKLSEVEKAIIQEGRAAIPNFRAWLDCPYNGFWRPVDGQLRLNRAPETLKAAFQVECQLDFEPSELREARQRFLNGEIEAYPLLLPSMVTTNHI